MAVYKWDFPWISYCYVWLLEGTTARPWLVLLRDLKQLEPDWWLCGGVWLARSRFIYMCIYILYIWYIPYICTYIYICTFRSRWIIHSSITRPWLQGPDKVMPISHSFRFPRLWTQHQEVMRKSCLLVFPHCERKRQNSPFQIGTFHFRFFFSSLPLRFNISYLPTFSPNRFIICMGFSVRILYINRYWVAMAPLHRKRPRQFVSSYSFERVAVLGRIILLLSPGLHSWHALRLRSGCSGPPGYTMLEFACVLQKGTTSRESFDATKYSHFLKKGTTLSSGCKIC